jgi:uncharacterized protein
MRAGWQAMPMKLVNYILKTNPMKKVVLLIALFCTALLFSQDHYYHPYILEVRDSGNFYEFEGEILPEFIDAKYKKPEEYGTAIKITETTQDGRKVVSLYYNNKLVSKKSYKKDVLDGTYTIYFANGTLCAEVPFVKGKANGVGKAYDDKGILRVETTFKNNQRHGVRRLYSRYHGQVIEGNFEKGSLVGDIKVTGDGPDTWYFPADFSRGSIKVYSGTNKLMEMPVIEGEKLHGEAIEYYTGGSKKTSFNFDKGKRHGTSYYYNADGTVLFKNDYKYDKPVGNHVEIGYKGIVLKEEFYDSDGNKYGRWITRDSKGNITQEENYANNMLNGTFKKYTGGVLRHESVYVNDKPEGIEKLYDSNGAITEVKHYKNGEKEYMETYYKSGPVFAKSYYNGSTPVKTVCYDAEGKILTEVQFNKNGQPVGLYRQIYPLENGNYHIMSDTYYDDKGIKTMSRSYRNGNLNRYTEVNYKDNRRHGPSTVFDGDANTKTITWYFNDKQVTEEEYKKLIKQ